MSLLYCIESKIMHTYNIIDKRSSSCAIAIAPTISRSPAHSFSQAAGSSTSVLKRPHYHATPTSFVCRRDCDWIDVECDETNIEWQ